MRSENGWNDKRVLLFGGTTEGRLIAACLSKLRCPAVICVATEYGRELLEQDMGSGDNAACRPDSSGNRQGRARDAGQEGSDIRQGRLDQAAMEALIDEVKPGIVIDATHPYAVEVTKNIKRACLSYPQVRLIRCKRAESELPGEAGQDLICVPDIEAAVLWLSGTKGAVLVTTGVKELAAFCGLKDYRQRVYARVLPSVESVGMCKDLGYDGRHIIAMQGPFSMEMNLALLREYGCSYLVTKDGGAAGGMEAKLEAARAAGAKTLLIGRPDSGDGISLEEVIRQIKEWMDHER